MEKTIIFTDELNLIKSEDIRLFAKYLINSADDYFFSVPASSSGKYHPEFALGTGGLIRHTKAVCYFTFNFSNVALLLGDITEREKDMLILSALVHDIKKQGDGHTGHTLMKEHPFYAAEYLKKIYNSHKELLSTITSEELHFMEDVVISHMGPWSETLPQTASQKLLFYADYAASRKEVDLKIFKNDAFGDSAPLLKEKSETKIDVSEFRFTFGKHKNKNLDEVYSEDRNYLEWISNKDDFFRADIRELVKEFLEKKSNNDATR